MSFLIINNLVFNYLAAFLWQCGVSDQIQNKRSDQMLKSEFKNDRTDEI
jgi:hypothetical protein